MALFHLNQSYAWSPQLYTLQGSFVDPLPANSNVNRQITPALVLVSAGAGGLSYVGADKRVAPLSALMKVFARPNGAAVSAVGSDALPRGVVQQTPDQALYLLDFSAHPGDLICAEVTLTPHNFTLPIARTATAIAIDNTNKLVYVQVTNLSGASTQALATDQICFDVVMKDGGIQP